MKLVIVTAVEEFQNEVLELFKKAPIENVSTSEIDGYKNTATVLGPSNWFFGSKSGEASSMLFSLTDDDHIDNLFQLIEAFNARLETSNPIKAVVVPVERGI
jgi:hypothetical protein